LPAFSAELHISVSSSKKIGLYMGDHGKIWEISWKKGGLMAKKEENWA